MITPSLLPLLDLCYIHVAYLLWSQMDNGFPAPSEENVSIDGFVKIVSTKVESLHSLPKNLKSGLLKHVEPIGECLLSLMYLWIPKIQLEISREPLTSDMFFESLVLNGNGLINQRKTAEKLLSSTMLDNIFAFRLACITFLESEVLKLWTVVKQYFLNKIVLECEISQALKTEYFCGEAQPHHYKCHNVRKFPNMARLAEMSIFPCTNEPQEVLFWIGYCLSKENAVDIKRLPHFSGKANWCKFSVESAAFSGNATCFEYFTFRSNFRFEYDSLVMLGKIFASRAGGLQSCFIFHFMLLDSEAQRELFQKYPQETLSYFLQWPLSLTFVEKPEEFWNLLSRRHKTWIFKKLLSILLYKNTEAGEEDGIVFFSDDLFICQFKCRGIINGIYSIDHVESILMSLWNLSPESHKSALLDPVVFRSIILFLRSRKFIAYFKNSGLKEKMRKLFLSNGEAVLEFYEIQDVKKSLRSFVAKHFPEHYEDLDKSNALFLDRKTATSVAEKGVLREGYAYIDYPELDYPTNDFNPLHKKFLIYIERILFSSFRN